MSTKILEKKIKGNWTKVDISKTNKTLEQHKSDFKKKPDWIRVKLPTGKKYTDLRNLVEKYKLNTLKGKHQTLQK